MRNTATTNEHGNETMTTTTRRPTATRLGPGHYRVTVHGRTYEIEGDRATTGYGLSGTRPVWDLFETSNGRRVYVNDFDSKRDAVDHAMCAGS